MHSWKSADCRRASAEFAAAMLLFSSVAATADGIVVEYASTAVSGEQYLLDASLRFDFGEEIIAALEHGVELRIDVPIRIAREREWLWDKAVAEVRLGFTLQNHPLSEDYVVTESHTGSRIQFSSYAAAMKYLGTIRNYPVADRQLIQPEHHYRGRIRARLDLHALPVPLQPSAFASAAWRLESAWYEWVVR